MRATADWGKDLRRLRTRRLFLSPTHPSPQPSHTSLTLQQTSRALDWFRTGVSSRWYGHPDNIQQWYLGGGSCRCHLVKRYPTKHIHQCASISDLPVASLSLYLPSTSKLRYRHASGLACLELYSPTMHQTVCEEALALVHRTSMSFPLHHPSYRTFSQLNIT